MSTLGREENLPTPYLVRNLMCRLDREDVSVSSWTGKIVRGEINCQKVYEDNKCLAFHDLNPQAPVHIILVPKELDGLTRLSNATETNKDILGHLLWTVSVIAKKENIGDFRVVINDGPKGCQSVYHLHLHILGGRQMNWPPG
eukprot:GHVS01014496.1.p1 GENE.GHVS01014496.1~~GHVS01014496.1.p1  ORF type:complete len:143 (+),score=7.49 GHVS01014496.1:129-557(+)